MALDDFWRVYQELSKQARFLTWKFGFWEPSQQCLDLSCLPVWICLVSWSGFVLSLGQLKQANFRSSGGQLDKETSNTSTAQLGESLRTTTVPWNRESSPSILMSITPLSVKVWECCSSSIYLKILGQPFLGWKLQRTLNKIYLKYTRLAQKTKGITVKFCTRSGFSFYNVVTQQMRTWLSSSLGWHVLKR